MAKHPSPSTVGLQVIGAGLPRTSTSSLHSGLNILGYNCYHTITDLLPNVRTHGPLWLAAMHATDKATRQKTLAQIVASEQYTAIVDGPGCFFVADWIEMYPDAKVVLGLRQNAHVWLTSVNGTIGKAFGHGPLYWLMYFVPEMNFGFRLNNLWDVQTQEKYGVGVMTTEYYQMHNEEIRNLVPKERLLEFQAKDGWTPLCRFLGKDVPAGTFPHRNDAKAANQLLRSFMINGVGVWTAILLSGWAVVWYLLRYIKV